MASDIRVRLAPSPTGKLHLGTARTGLFNYLFAKRQGGTFVLRIEDTDQDRSSDEFTDDITRGLQWLGLQWDEGPEVGGPYQPYFQHDRLRLYQPYIDQLLEHRQAYRCYCSAEELEAEREAQRAKNQPPKYSGKCRHLTRQEIDQYEREGRSFTIRVVVEPQVVHFKDLIRGEVEFDSNLIGDFVIVRSNGEPLFIFAVVIDDALMKISHVLRGEDHLANTAKHILIAQTLNLPIPEFGHFPLILNANRTKMSKRKDPVSITDDYQAKGYLPEAMVNFIALLGWSNGADREIFSLRELEAEFSLERVGKSPAIFDPEKLLWMNGYYIRHKKIGELAQLVQPFINNEKLARAVEENQELYLRTIALVQERMKTLAEVEELIDFVFLGADYEGKLLVAKKSTETRTLTALKVAAEVIKSLSDMTPDHTEPALRAAAKDNDLKDGELLWTVRVALSGKPASPGTFELIELLGQAESLKRIKTALKRL